MFFLRQERSSIDKCQELDGQMWVIAIPPFIFGQSRVMPHEIIYIHYLKDADDRLFYSMDDIKTHAADYFKVFWVLQTSPHRQPLLRN